jgi:hypothetical protein
MFLRVIRARNATSWACGSYVFQNFRPFVNSWSSSSQASRYAISLMLFFLLQFHVMLQQRRRMDFQNRQQLAATGEKKYASMGVMTDDQCEPFFPSRVPASFFLSAQQLSSSTDISHQPFPIPFSLWLQYACSRRLGFASTTTLPEPSSIPVIDGSFFRTAWTCSHIPRRSQWPHANAVLRWVRAEFHCGKLNESTRCYRLGMVGFQERVSLQFWREN